MKLTKTNKLILKAVILMLILGIAAGLIGCKRKVVQYGYVDQNATEEDLNIRGTITLTVTDDLSEDAEMAPRNIINAFMSKYPDTKVIFQKGARSSFPTRISAGDIGDVFWVDPIDCNDYQQNHNALMPLDSYLKPLNIDIGDVFSGALDCGKVAGRLYMAPRAIAEQILIYNQTMLESAGIDFDNSYAYTWEDFKDVCKRLTVIENGTVTQSGASLKIWWEPVWPMFFRGFGGEWINSIEHRVSITSSTEVMQGINEIVTGVQEGWLFPEDISNQITAIKYSVGDGQANMAHVCFKTFNGMSWLFSYGKLYDDLQIDWDLCPFPAFPYHNISTGATGYVVYNRTDNPDTAAAFALFFLTPEGQIAHQGQTGGNVPVLKSLSDDDFWKGVGTEWHDKNYAALVSYPDQTRPCNTVLFAPIEIADIFSNANMTSAFVRIINGTADAQTVFGRMERQANEKWQTIMS